MRYPFESDEAKLLNKQIFETIYYGAMESSSEIAEKEGPYSTYEGSPVSKGIFQFDMWNVKPSDLWDWTALKAKVAKSGVRNSLLLAPMPTASTAQVSFCADQEDKRAQALFLDVLVKTIPTEITNHAFIENFLEFFLQWLVENFGFSSFSGPKEKAPSDY